MEEPISKTTPKTTDSRLKLVLILLGAAVIIAGIALVVTQKSKSSPKTPAAKKATPASVSITNAGFLPATIEVKPGTQVTWNNADAAIHQVAADPYPKNDSIPGFNSTVILAAKDTFSFTFSRAGTYTYHDERNPLKYKGTVVVR